MERPRVSLLVGSIVVVSLLLGGPVDRDVCAQQPKRDKAAPGKFEGLELTGGQAKVKAGYRPVKISSNKVAVQRMRGGGPGAVEVDCTCRSSGSCDIEIIGDVIRCQPAGGCTGCDRIISVPGGLQPPARY